MISRWLCAVYNLARVKSIKRNVEHTVHGYIRIIKLNITIAKDRSYSKLLSEKFSPLQFPWTMNYNEERNQSRTSIFVRIRSIAFNEWKQTGKGFFAWKVRGVRISSLPSLGRRGGGRGGGEGASCPAKVAKRGLSPTYTISGPHTHRALYFASRYCPGGSESVLKFPQRRTRISLRVSGQQKSHSRERY